MVLSRITDLLFNIMLMNSFIKRLEVEDKLINHMKVLDPHTYQKDVKSVKEEKWDWWKSWKGKFTNKTMAESGAYAEYRRENRKKKKEEDRKKVERE